MSDWLDAEAHADRALHMFERGRWAEAEAELRKALSLNPEQAEWHFNLGLTLEQAGRDMEALASYERAMELMGDQAEPFVAAGIVANRLSQYHRAIAMFDAALRIDAEFEEAYAHKIESQIRLGNHEEAETTFYLSQHALENPSAQCLAVMAESLIQRGQFERAEWCLKEAMRLEPSMPRLRARMAAVLAATGKPQRALQLYLRELRDDPGNIDTLLEYGELLIEIGRLPEAAEKFRRVLELEPANVEAHYALGRIALRTQRFEQATLEFELVLKLDGQFPGVRLAIGEAWMRRERLDDAKRFLIEEYDAIKAGEAGPLSDGEPAAARTGLELDHLASLLLEVGEPAKAAELLELSLKSGETADRLRMLALARFSCGERLRGSAASRRVLRLDPRCIRSIHNLAFAALQEGQLRMASGWLQRGLRLNHNDDGLRRLRIRLWIAQLAQFWMKLIKRTK